MLCSSHGNKLTTGYGQLGCIPARTNRTTYIHVFSSLTLGFGRGGGEGGRDGLSECCFHFLSMFRLVLSLFFWFFFFAENHVTLRLAS